MLPNVLPRPPLMLPRPPLFPALQAAPTALTRPCRTQVPWRSLRRCGRGIDHSGLRLLKRTVPAASDELTLQMALINVRSLASKTFMLNNFFISRELDFLFLCETWVSTGENILEQFEPITLSSLSNAVRHMQPSNCPSDCLPSRLLKDSAVFDTVSPHPSTVDQPHPLLWLRPGCLQACRGAATIKEAKPRPLYSLKLQAHFQATLPV